MEIRLGPAGIPLSCKNCNTLEGVKKVAELGLSAMEVEFVRGVNLSREKARELGRIAEELNVELSVHAPYYINLASEDEEKVNASVKRILDSLDRAELMGAGIVVVHAGYYGKDKEKAGEMIERKCAEIAEVIEKNSWKVKLGLETMGKQSQWGTLEEIARVCKRLRACAPVIDFAHIYARNGGEINYPEILDTVKKLRVGHVHSHFSGMEFTKTLAGGNEKRHLPIKKARGPDFEALAREILRRKVSITIISESPILERDSLLMKEILEKLGYKFK